MSSDDRTANSGTWDVPGLLRAVHMMVSVREKLVEWRRRSWWVCERSWWSGGGGHGECVRGAGGVEKEVMVSVWEELVEWRRRSWWVCERSWWSGGGGHGECVRGAGGVEVEVMVSVWEELVELRWEVAREADEWVKYWCKRIQYCSVLIVLWWLLEL